MRETHRGRRRYEAPAVYAVREGIEPASVSHAGELVSCVPSRIRRHEGRLRCSRGAPALYAERGNRYEAHPHAPCPHICGS
jgi:hypothetical protein